MSTVTESARDELRRLQDQHRRCPYCEGNGMAIVFHPAWSGGRIATRDELNAHGELVPVSFPAEVAAHCCCPVGEWMRNRTDPQLQRRIPWVTDVIAGRSRWTLRPPHEEADDAMKAPTRDDINAIFRRPA